MSGEHDPVMVTPDCFTHLTDETIGLRQQIDANRDFHTLSDPLGMPDGVLSSGHHDYQSGEVKRFWEGQRCR